MANYLVTTKDEYTEEDVKRGGLMMKTVGSLKEYQKVVAVGPMVRGIQVGDLVCINPKRYAQYKHKPGSLKDGVITDNEVIASTDFVLSSPPKVDTDKKEFADKLTSLFGRNTARAWQQAEKYRRELGYTYKGMAQALEYFYEIKENSIEKSCGGIGIIPYIYQKAIDFYKQIEEDRQRAAASLKNYSTQVETIAILSPSNKKRLNDEFFMEEEDNGQ